MASIVMHSRSGPDSKLHLEVPVGQPDADFEVEVIVRPKAACAVGSDNALSLARSFPPGYFDLIGSVDDETLIVHPQPPMPSPVEIE